MYIATASQLCRTWFLLIRVRCASSLFPFLDLERRSGPASLAILISLRCIYTVPLHYLTLSFLALLFLHFGKSKFVFVEPSLDVPLGPRDSSVSTPEPSHSRAVYTPPVLPGISSTISNVRHQSRMRSLSVRDTLDGCISLNTPPPCMCIGTCIFVCIHTHSDKSELLQQSSGFFIGLSPPHLRL